MIEFASIPKGAKPSKSLSKDQARPVLCGAQVVQEGDDKFLYATDSYKLARVTIHDPDDTVTPGPIPGEALKAIEKAGGQFRANGAVELPNGVSFPRPELGKFPDCRQLFPDAPARSFKLGVNAALLKELADSLGAGAKGPITLTFDLDKCEEGGCYLRAILAEANGERGVIMPVRVA